ncbi:hypothetical protein HOY80DRAFT_134800 [Tuber brumale]|nr:hypothetical protein HOY80DRAFT_134800 [Tuber brumale]
MPTHSRAGLFVLFPCSTLACLPFIHMRFTIRRSFAISFCPFTHRIARLGWNRDRYGRGSDTIARNAGKRVVFFCPLRC